MSTPRIIPNIPPRIHRTIASIINCIIITELVAPNALRKPISFVLSVTDTSIIFITPIPPTSKLIEAIPVNKAVKIAVACLCKSAY